MCGRGDLPRDTFRERFRLRCERGRTDDRDDLVTGESSLRVSRESVRVSFVGGWMMMVRWAVAGEACVLQLQDRNIHRHARLSGPVKWGRCDGCPASPRLASPTSLSACVVLLVTTREVKGWCRMDWLHCLFPPVHTWPARPTAGGTVVDEEDFFFLCFRTHLLMTSPGAPASQLFSVHLTKRKKDSFLFMFGRNSRFVGSCWWLTKLCSLRPYLVHKS